MVFPQEATSQQRSVSLFINLNENGDVKADGNGARLPARLDPHSFSPEISYLVGGPQGTNLNADGVIMLKPCHCETIAVQFPS